MNSGSGIVVSVPTTDFTCRVCHKPLTPGITDGRIVVACEEHGYVGVFLSNIQLETEVWRDGRFGDSRASPALLKRCYAACAKGLPKTVDGFWDGRKRP